MPAVKEGESRDDYMERCMVYPDLQKHDEKQRVAICEHLYDRNAKGEGERKEQSVETERTEQTTEVKPRIDREAGILRHVLVAGMKSKNDGVEYSLEAHRKAAPRFEQMPVGLDHDYQSAPLKIASAWGVLSNPVVEADGVYADLTYLKTHERTEQVLEDAERSTGLFSLSMVCKARQRGNTIDEYIPSRTDLVVRGATTRTLFNQEQAKEGAEGIALAALKEELEAVKSRLEQVGKEQKVSQDKLARFEQAEADKKDLNTTINSTLEKAQQKGLDLKAFWQTK